MDFGLAPAARPGMTASSIRPAPEQVQLIVEIVVHGDRAAPPVAGRAHPFRVGAVVGDELGAQRLGGEQLARNPCVVVAGGHAQSS